MRTLKDAVALFKRHGISQLPVLDDGRLAGILTETDVLHALVEGNAQGTQSIAEVMVRKVTTVAPATPTSELPELFERGEVALVVDENQRVLGIVTKLDLIDHLTRSVSVD